MYDIIVIGGGPSGLTASIYARRAGKSVLVIEKDNFGGQITFSPRVENIPGFSEISGNEFAEKLVEQAIFQEAEFESAEVTGIKDGPEFKTVITDIGKFEGKAVIIATGAKHRTLGLPDEENYIGHGISFCAVCDGAFCEGLDAVVVGGGNSALQEAVLLADIVRKLYIVQDLEMLTGEAALQEKLRSHGNVEIITSSLVESYLGDGEELSGVRIVSKTTGEKREILCQTVFVAIGLIPQNEPFSDIISLNSYGYADSSEDTLTKTPGVFAAGDCRSKKTRQVVTAASDGAAAALAACDFVDKLEK